MNYSQCVVKNCQIEKIRKTSRKRTKTTGSKHIVSPDAHGHNSSSPQNTATMKSHAAMLGG